MPLLRNLQRLTAANPGAMTGPGTNSYLVGDPSTGYIAIDPGPADEVHLERLWHAAGGDIRAIVPRTPCRPRTGRRPLAARVAAAGRPRPPVLGMPSAPGARSQPVHARPCIGRRRTAHQPRPAAGRRRHPHPRRSVHTPGHAANHLCLLLREDGLLFSGDHILNGSTTVIDPPDGNMDDYLASLDRLDALRERHGVEFVLPAHGRAIAGARGGDRRG